MTPAEAALARHHSYALLSRLFLDGLTADLLPTLQHVAELAELLPGSFDGDEAAATHYDLFGLNVFPYEAVFLDSSAQGSAVQLGGPITHSVEQCLREASYAMGSGDASHDHIGHELGYLAHLSGAEADAWQDELAKTAWHIRLRQRDFLREHLLRWLPALCQAIRDQSEPFYAALIDLVLELVQDHALALSGTAAAPSPHNGELPQAPPLLEDEKTGLRQIARFLSVPRLSGIYLSRDAMSALARDLQLPRGFGSRDQILENMFYAAVQYDALDALLGSLDDIASRWDHAYRRAFVPVLQPFVQPWQARVTATRALLQELATLSQDYSG